MVQKSKGYQLYDPNRGGKVIYSRDVKFNEMEFGLEKESSSVKPTQYVELEVRTQEAVRTLLQIRM